MATVKYLSSLENEKERKSLVSTSVAMVVVLSLLFAAAFIAAADVIAGLASVTRVYAVASIAVALLYAAWTYSQDILKGLGEMKMVGAMNVVHAVTIVGLSVVLLLDARTAAVPVIAICGGYLLSMSAVFVFSGQRRYISLQWNIWRMVDGRWARILLGYGGIAVVAIFSSSVVGNINQLLINRFLDLKTVGIYQAYYLSTIGVVTFFVNILVTVFFPASSKYGDKSVIFRQMRRLFLLMPVLFAVVCAASYVIITLYGSGYPIMPDVIVMFSLATVLVFMYTTYNVFSSSLGISGIKATTISIIMISVIGAASSYVLIPTIQIRGAVFSIILSHAIGMVAIYLMAGRLLKKKDKTAPHKKH
jgi:O-antigen/teichoic acid export membrane protein